MATRGTLANSFPARAKVPVALVEIVSAVHSFVNAKSTRFDEDHVFTTMLN